MRTIAFVHPSSELYGSDRALLALVRGLDPARWRVRVVLPGPGPLADALEAAGAEPVASPALAITRPRRPLRFLARALPDLRALDRSLGSGGRPEVVATNTLAALGGALWARARGVPHLWLAHEVAPPAAARVLAPLALATSARMVCNSAATRDALLAAAPGLAGRARVIPPAVEPQDPDAWEQPAADLRRGLGVAPGALLCGVVGWVSPRKGHGLALAALEQAGLPSAHLLFVGGGAPGHPRHEAALRARAARSPCWARVHRLPFLAEVRPALAACDLVLVPSTEPEGFGLAAAEAMALGRPVLASRLGGLVEVVRHEESGLLLPPDDAAAWAAALRRAADPALRARWGARGREEAGAWAPGVAARAFAAVLAEL